MWQNRVGHITDISVHPLATIQQWLREEIEKLLWDMSSVNKHAEDSDAWMQPLRAAVLNRKEPVIGGMARSAAINTQWKQERVAASGYADADDNKCRLCGQEEGTLYIRARIQVASN